MGEGDAKNVGIAFALVIAAGASTGLGAAVVFFPSFVRLASRTTLAGALGLSAGVMTYVSFVEIFQKSVGAFEAAEYDDGDAYLYATLSFFGGVAFMTALGFVVHNLLGSGHAHSSADDDTARKQNHPNGNTAQDSVERGSQSGEQETQGITPQCCAEDPGAQLDNIKEMAERVESLSDDDSEDSSEDGEEKQKLVQMSMNTAVAIALHNFPEGLATFVAAVNDPGVGAVLAFAIAIHNIPEGLCVAMPVYYGTGNRMKAFMWALFSGLSEPIAAILGYIILAQSFSEKLYGAMFGIVAGMMVMISVRELLPTAHRYDPHDSVVTYSFILGMIIMALSLVLFAI